MIPGISGCCCTAVEFGAYGYVVWAMRSGNRIYALVNCCETGINSLGYNRGSVLR